MIGTGSGRIVVDPVDTDELVEQANERAGRELTADECERFLHDPDCAADDERLLTTPTTWLTCAWRPGRRRGA